MPEEPQWQTRKLSISLPGEIDKILKTYDELASKTTGVLEFVKSGLTAAKVFLTDGVNPLLLALAYVLDQILNVIDNIKNTGVYMLGMYPNEATNSQFIEYRKVIPGFNLEEKTGFYVLDTDTALNKLAASFDDPGDDNRPSTEEHVVAGACVIFAGAGKIDLIENGSSLVNIVNTFQTIANLFTELFHLDQFKKFQAVLDKMLADIAAAGDAEQDRSAAEIVTAPKSIAPDWQTKRFSTDTVPVIGDVLNDIEGVVQGFRDQIVGTAEAMDNLIAYIEAKIAEIETLQEQIAAVQQQIRDLIILLDQLATFNFSILYLEPQTGGVNILKNALKDTRMDNRPESNLQFTCLVAFVGSGTGFSLLANLLGLSSSVQLGVVDNVEFQDNVMKAQHNLT